MEELGPPVSYLVLEEGTDVYASDGEKLGKVVEIRADEQNDIFDGLVIDRTPLLPGGHRYVAAEQVERIHERGVVLALDSAAAESLPEPE
jgi:uncharacterized protein YrrD